MEEIKENTTPKVKTNLKEKFFYAFGNMGSYILWAFIGTYVTIYVTDCVQPGDELISLFGTIVLVCRIFDGFSDILMGAIIEKTHSKLGKARFWFGISIIPLTVVFFFIFFTSGLDKSLAIIMISILYFLFTVIFYTMNNVSFNAMLPRITDDPYDQSNVCTINSIFTSVGSLVCAFAIPIMNIFGGEKKQDSWTYFVIILIAIALIGEILCFFKVKEKQEIKVQEKEHREKGEVKKGLKALLKTKYFYIAVLMFAINYYLSLSATSIGKYYAEFVLGDVNYFSLFGSLPMISMGVGLLLTPLLVKKLSKKYTLSIAISCVVLGNVIGAIFPYNFIASLIGVMIKGLGSAVVMSQLFTLAPDLVRYISIKDGIKVEGLAASANSFGSKIGSGLGTAITLWSLSLCGYVASEATQPSSAIYTFITLYWWVPALLSIVLLVLSLFWDINKKSKILEDKN
ncbi:MAG: glycoside-pentoside-hexuronide (GPH):cation symporter [Bacilli bacterium]